MIGVYLDVAPLVDAVTARGGTEALGRGLDEREQETLRRTYQRAKQRGTVPLFTADQLAVRGLGQHPALLWPEWSTV